MSSRGTRATASRPLAVGLIAIALSVASGACSDDDSSGGGLDPADSTTQAVPLDDWVRAVNQICLDATDEADLDQPRSNADPKEFADYERDVGALLADVADEIDDTGTPDQKVDEADEVTADLELLAGLFDDVADALEDGDAAEAQSVVDEVDSTFSALLDVIDELGIDDCADVGSAVGADTGTLGPAS